MVFILKWGPELFLADPWSLDQADLVCWKRGLVMQGARGSAAWHYNIANACMEYSSVCRGWVNSLVPEGCANDFKMLIFQLIIQNVNLVNRCEVSLRCMPQNLTDDKSTLVQVMAWCRQATSHHLNQCWPKYMSPYGVTRPQWVKSNVIKFRNMLADMIKWGIILPMINHYGPMTFGPYDIAVTNGQYHCFATCKLQTFISWMHVIYQIFIQGASNMY